MKTITITDNHAKPTTTQTEQTGDTCWTKNWYLEAHTKSGGYRTIFRGTYEECLARLIRWPEHSSRRLDLWVRGWEETIGGYAPVLSVNVTPKKPRIKR